MILIKEINSYRSIIDYIYLLRKMKFSKSGLIKLFQVPEMDIYHFKHVDKDKLLSYLLLRKKRNLDDYRKVSNLNEFNYKDQEYLQIEELVKACLLQKIKILTPFEKNIPKLLQILKRVNRDLVFIKGQLIDKDLKSYSICGTRMPSQDAIDKTHRIAEVMAKNGFTLINGFAKGIDIEAFLGCHEQNGRYIGVLASGVENIYPPENNKYASIVIRNGAFISQALIWNRVTKPTLQMRNKLSAQLALGSIFIEGNYKSGTKWQFKFASDLKRPTFYLEPKDWNHENSHVLKIIRDGGGIEIKNDLSNIDLIVELFEEEYRERMEAFNNSRDFI